MNTLTNAFKKSLFGPIDLFDCGTRMVNTIGPRITDDERGGQITDCLKEALQNLNTVTERTRKRPQTKLIMECDAKRDELLLMFRDTVKGNTHNVMNSKAREAANTLSRLYADHIGNTSRMGLGEESKAVRYLLDALAESKYSGCAGKLGLDSLIASLAEVQSKIEALYVERTTSEPQPGTFTIKKHMATTVDALRRFLGYLDVLVTDGTAKSAANSVAALAIINDVEAIARARKTRMHNGDAEQPGESLNEAA
jgi:hypothetical protein